MSAEWKQTGRTFTLSLGGFHLVEVVIRRDCDWHVESSKWEIAVRGIHETGPVNEVGATVKFTPENPLETQPAPVVFARALEFAQKAVAMIQHDLDSVSVPRRAKAPPSRRTPRS